MPRARPGRGREHDATERSATELLRPGAATRPGRRSPSRRTPPPVPTPSRDATPDPGSRRTHPSLSAVTPRTPAEPTHPESLPVQADHAVGDPRRRHRADPDPPARDVEPGVGAPPSNARPDSQIHSSACCSPQLWPTIPGQPSTPIVSPSTSSEPSNTASGTGTSASSGGAGPCTSTFRAGGAAAPRHRRSAVTSAPSSPSDVAAPGAPPGRTVLPEPDPEAPPLPGGPPHRRGPPGAPGRAVEPGAPELSGRLAAGRHGHRVADPHAARRLGSSARRYQLS